MARVYLDTCSLNRPLDDKLQLRVALEAEAVLRILAACDAGEWTLISSEVLKLEVEKSPIPQRRQHVAAILAGARIVIVLDDAIEHRARDLEKRGFKGFDALHVVCAESAKADYFCSCDDRLLNKCRQQADLNMKVVSPLELADEVPHEE